MAVEKNWIKYTVAVTSALLMLFGIAQIGLTLSMNVIYGGVLAPAKINTAVELVGLAVLLFPALWVGIAAAISRHRGVYIMSTVLCCLAVLMAAGFIAYESYVFTMNGYFLNTFGGELQGIAITKLVVWCVITLLLIIFLGVLIAGDCSRNQPEFKYMSYGHGYPPPPMYNMMEYGRHGKEQQRSASYRYSDYVPAALNPRMYYSTKSPY